MRQAAPVALPTARYWSQQPIQKKTKTAEALPLRNESQETKMWAQGLQPLTKMVQQTLDLLPMNLAAPMARCSHCHC